MIGHTTLIHLWNTCGSIAAFCVVLWGTCGLLLITCALLCYSLHRAGELLGTTQELISFAMWKNRQQAVRRQIVGR